MDPSVREIAERFGARPFAPLGVDHSLVRSGVCAICERPFQMGEVPALVVRDTEGNRNAAAVAQEHGKDAYNAEATPVHWVCLTQSTTPEDDYLEWAAG